MVTLATPRVSVVIVNWHSEDLLADALSALNNQTVIPANVVIVDNGSNRPIPLDRYTKGPASILRMATNVGFAAANNRAIEQEIDAEWVALLNPDATPEQDWLERLLEAVELFPEICAFGSRQLMSEDHSLIDGLGDVYHVSGAAWRHGHGKPDRNFSLEPREIFAPCAAAAMYKRSALIEAGGFDEDFFCYFEDVDLGFRLRLLGYKIMLVPTAVVFHQGGATSGGGQSDFAVYHGQRNLIWAYLKNMPSSMFWRYFFQHVLFNLAAILFFAFAGRGSAVLRAKWDALGGLPGMIRKRRSIQSQRRISCKELGAVMESDWLAPYRR